MAQWDAGGYVTDTAYLHDFCQFQTPAILSIVALAKGVLPPELDGGPITYCDLGCGQGFTANLVAAANPHAEIVAADFNPSHIAGARNLAQAAGLENVIFRESDFGELLDDASLPDFDFICLHGVYSWISAENRQRVVTFLHQRLKPGGLVYVSYDAMPGWAAMAPLPRVLVQQAASSGAPSETALQQGFAFANKLKDLNARFYRMYPHVSAQMERFQSLPSAYLAHELLTRNWQAFSFADVAEELAAAKLTYLGSAYLIDHIDRINFTEEQQAFLAEIQDPLLAETTRDMIVGRQFRRDVFAKGFIPLPPTEIRERWLNMCLVLTVPAEEVDLRVDSPLGKLQLRPDVYAPMLELLADRPMTVRELIERMPEPRPTWVSLADAIKVLIGRGQVYTALPGDGQAERAISTNGFNNAVLARANSSRGFGYLASPVTGGGVRVDHFAQLYLCAIRQGAADPAGLIKEIAMKNGHSIDMNDRRVGPEQIAVAVDEEIGKIKIRTLPLLKRLGVM